VSADQSGGTRRKAKGAKMLTLEKELDELIAQQEKVRPDQVTLELIRERREVEVYPKAPIDFANNMGGCNPTGRFYSLAEAKATIEKAYRFLMQFGKKQ